MKRIKFVYDDEFFTKICNSMLIYGIIINSFFLTQRKAGEA